MNHHPDHRRLLPRVALLAVLVLIAAGCVAPPDPTGDGGASLTPPSCPYDQVIHLDGDSLAAGYAAEIELPNRSIFSAAVGGTSFSQIGTKETIDDRIVRWIDQCGHPDLVVIEGGMNDLLNGVSTADLIAEVAALRDLLAARGIPAMWLTIPPLAEPGGYVALNPARREFNAWLTSPEGMGSAAIDVVPAMQDPYDPDTLAPAYWWFWKDLIKPDGIHPNRAGYNAMAGVVAAAIEARLAG